VDTSNKDKILTVQFVSISEEQVIDAVQKAGYKIESLNK
jgi:copper chaperone CopZ